MLIEAKGGVVASGNQVEMLTSQLAIAERKAEQAERDKAAWIDKILAQRPDNAATDACIAQLGQRRSRGFAFIVIWKEVTIRASATARQLRFSLQHSMASLLGLSRGEAPAYMAIRPHCDIPVSETVEAGNPIMEIKAGFNATKAHIVGESKLCQPGMHCKRL